MRTVVVSDIHANVPAFEAILRHAESNGAIDAVWHIGDLVGYGPEPSEVISRLREFRHLNVMGNHDLAAVGGLETTGFSALAAQAAEWTLARLSDDDVHYLRSLPRTIGEGDFTLVHGTLRDPVWEYLITESVAMTQFDRMERRYCLVGHSHLPMVVEEPETSTSEGVWPMPRLRAARDGTRVTLADRRLILNPGGVGQPRDGDPRTAYALYDSDDATVTFHRVEYDIATMQQRMKDAGLPTHLITRLSHGR